MQAPEGWYMFVCLPLRLEDGDGAPARAVLLSGAIMFDQEDEK
jgi:kynurenine formamidase